MSAEGGNTYSQIDGNELKKLLSQTDVFVRTCNTEQLQCSVDMRELTY